MKEEINKKVVDQYQYYTDIKESSKRIECDEVALVKHRTHATVFTCEIPVQHELPGKDRVVIKVEGDQSSISDFSFKLFDRDFMPCPCYRFDASGGSHRNFTDGPLRTRQVDTPHFHRYDASGRNVAYRTEFINKHAADLVADRSAALKHFCEEENVEIAGAAKVLHNDLFQPKVLRVDPLKDILFYE